MQCADLTESLAGAADGVTELSRAERRHVERCLRCKAEIVQYLATHFPPNERLAHRLVHGRGRDRVQGILLKRAARPFRSGER